MKIASIEWDWYGAWMWDWFYENDPTTCYFIWLGEFFKQNPHLTDEDLYLMALFYYPDAIAQVEDSILGKLWRIFYFPRNFICRKLWEFRIAHSFRTVVEAHPYHKLIEEINNDCDCN